MNHIIYLISATLVFFTSTLEAQTWSLEETSKVSAAVFDADTNLVRHLFADSVFHAGTHPDITFDSLSIIAPGGMVGWVANNIQVREKYTIGNTSRKPHGDGVHVSFQPWSDAVVWEGNVYASAGYTEGKGIIEGFSLSDPAYRISYMPYQNFGLRSPYKFYPSAYRISQNTDNFYTSGATPAAEENTYVVGVPKNNMANGPFLRTEMYTFKSGDSIYVFDLIEDGGTNSMITGHCASDEYLYTARKGYNSVHVVSLETGRVLDTLAIDSPTDLAVVNDTLWIADTAEIHAYTITGTALTDANVTLSGSMTDIRTIHLSPDSTKLSVVDAGIYDRVHIFDLTELTQTDTLGLAESYAVSSDVKPRKWMFQTPFLDGPFPEYGGFAPWTSDTSLLIGDTGNGRYEVISLQGELIDSVHYQEGCYSVQTVLNDSSRVFHNNREYQIDYTKVDHPTNRNGYWKLKNNWGEAYDEYYRNQYRYLNDPYTFSNGKTYTIVTPSGTVDPEIAEMVDGGVLRFTGVIVSDEYKSVTFTRQGAIRAYRDVSGKQQLWEWSGITFDGSNNPVLPVPTMYASISRTTPHISGGHSNVTGQSEHQEWFVYAGEALSGYHLGAVNPDGEYAFQAAPQIIPEINDPYPSKGEYDNRANVIAKGTDHWALDRYIFKNYIGEFWRSNQTNIFDMYHDYGLFLLQLGATHLSIKDYVNDPFMGGNANTFFVSKIGGDIHLHYGGEFQPSGIGGMIISNLKSVKMFWSTSKED